MNLYALLAGFLIAVSVVVGFRKAGFESKKRLYLFALASFPAYYWAFALYGSDYVALLKEVFAGALFLGVAALAYGAKRKTSLLMLSIGYLGHAGYDVTHNFLFFNPGAPDWWPEFCGVVDVSIGLYLVYLLASLPPRNSGAVQTPKSNDGLPAEARSSNDLKQQ